jgi:hypothetical protein
MKKNRYGTMAQRHHQVTQCNTQKKDGLSPLHDVYIITLLLFFIEMLQYDWL